MTAKKKITTALLIVVAAVALVAISIAGTVAYLTASSAVSNTFTVGNVFIEMFESPVDEDGKIQQGFSGKKNADGNSYHLQPGGTYIKDPSIYVQPTSDDCFLFVRARNQIRTIEKQDDVNNPTMAQQMAQHGWMVYDASQDATVGTVYVFCGKMVNGKNVELDSVQDADLIAKIAAGTATPTPIDKNGYVVDGVAHEQEIVLFHRFSINEEANVSLYGGAKVTLTAFAIQTTGFIGDGGTVNTAGAWAAIVAAYPYESGSTNP